MRIASEKNALPSWSELFDFHNVPGDGNCFLYALLKAAQPKDFLDISGDELHKRALELRHQIADYTEANQDLFREFIENEMELMMMLAKIRQDGTWCDEFTIRAATSVLKLNIVVLAQGCNTLIYGENPDRATIYLAYNASYKNKHYKDGNHYAALIPKPTAQELNPRRINCSSTFPWEGQTLTQAHQLPSEYPPCFNAQLISLHFNLLSFFEHDLSHLVTEYAYQHNPLVDCFNYSLYALGSDFMTLEAEEANKGAILKKTIASTIRHLKKSLSSTKKEISSRPIEASELVTFISQHTASLEELSKDITTAKMKKTFIDLLVLATELNNILCALYTKKPKTRGKHQQVYNPTLLHQSPTFVDLYFRLLPFLIAQHIPKLLRKPRDSSQTKENLFNRGDKLIQAVYNISERHRDSIALPIMYFFNLLDQFSAPMEWFADLIICLVFAQQKNQFFNSSTLGYVFNALARLYNWVEKSWELKLIIFRKFIEFAITKNANGEVRNINTFHNFYMRILPIVTVELQDHLAFPIEITTLESLLIALVKHLKHKDQNWPFQKAPQHVPSEDFVHIPHLAKDTSDRYLLLYLVQVLLRIRMINQDFLDKLFDYLMANGGDKLETWVSEGFCITTIFNLFASSTNVYHMVSLKFKRDLPNIHWLNGALPTFRPNLLPSNGHLMTAPEQKAMDLEQEPPQVGSLEDDGLEGTKRFAPSKLEDCTKNEKAILALFHQLNDQKLKREIIKLFEKDELDRAVLISFRDSLEEEQQQTVQALLNHLLEFFPKPPSGGMVALFVKKESVALLPADLPNFAKLVQILKEPAAKRPRR